MHAANIPFEMYREAHESRLLTFRQLERGFREHHDGSELHNDLWWAFHQFGEKNRIVAAHWRTAVSAAFRNDVPPIIGLLAAMDDALFLVDHLKVQLFRKHGLRRPPPEAAETAKVMNDLSKGLIASSSLFLLAAPDTLDALRSRRPNRPALDMLDQSSW